MMTCCILKNPFPAERGAWRVIVCEAFYTKGAVPQRGAVDRIGAPASSAINKRRTQAIWVRRKRVESEAQ